jgi:hypothetical protein
MRSTRLGSAFVSSKRASLALVVAFVFVTVAGCGGAPGGPAASPQAAPGASGGSAPASAPPQNGPADTGGAATFGDESFKGPMKPFAPSAMGADLKGMGLDPNALPPLDKLPPETLRKVMKTFSKALGARCSDCHIGGDFAAPTPRKAVATGMWNHFVRELSAKDGSPVYCDSCHQGTMTPLLDRHDDDALGQWMQANYVVPLKRRDAKDAKDAKEHKCATCHGEPFEGHFLKAWASASSVTAK